MRERIPGCRVPVPAKERKHSTAGSSSTGLSLVITCHAPYLPYLADATAAIDRQGVTPEIILTLDGCPADWAVKAGGIDPGRFDAVIEGRWGGPNAARNAALARATGGWIVYWDADNVMPPGYLAKVASVAPEAGPDVGILYPIVRAGDRRMGYPEGGDPREKFFVDTSSAWRREAVLSAGGWREDLRRFDDWELSQRIYRQGWEIQPLKVEILQRVGHKRRSEGLDEATATFEARDLGIVSLQRGVPGHFARFLRCLEMLTLPPRVGLTLVDNSGSAAFGRTIRGKLNALGRRFRRVTILTEPEQRRECPSPFESIHCHVAGLYGRAIAATPESALLAWEDDVFPEHDDALFRLSSAMRPGRQIAAVGAVYASRANKDYAVASRGEESEWRGMPRMAEIMKLSGPLAVGGLGGGFTLYSRPALERVPLRACRQHPQLGWDGDLSLRLREAGYQLLLHADVWAEHAV